MIIAFLPAAAPLALFLAACAAFARPALRPAPVPMIGELAGLAALAVAAASAVLLTLQGAFTARLDPTGWVSLRVDIVSVVMMLVVGFVGWVVLRFTRNYLDGEERQGAFTGWMTLALAAVFLLVAAGSLPVLIAGWIAASLCLQRLLLFYPGRKAALRAARKKAILARSGDVLLIAAMALLIHAYATPDIAAILAAAKLGEGGVPAILAAFLLASAAMLKSAQLPFHGWLTEVMETPTPVSALLHAGIINAGGFLLIRFADVMLLSPGVLALLAGVGGLSALVGGLVMLTQPAIKTQLAWSTIAQMGFMTMQCGLALFPLALLHIAAHSLYKAHAFLSSGEAVAQVAAAKRPGPVAVPSFGAVLRAFGLALLIYAATAIAFGVDGKSSQAIALGAILIFGVAYLIAQGLADAAPRALTIRTTIASVAASLSYFALQRGAEWLTSATLPAAPAPGPLEWVLVVLAVASFGAVALLQATFPLWAFHPASQSLRVHVANGFYLNALSDRLTGGWTIARR